LVNLCGIDSGDQTDDVYDFCADNSEWAIPVKGVPNGYSHFKISSINKTASKAYGARLLLVDGGKYKDMVASRMAKPNGRGSWMVYKGCDREYAEQVTAEHKVDSKGAGGKATQVWVLKTSHADNHFLDAEIYCLATADVLHVRTLHLTQQEEQAREVVADTNNIANDPWINQKGRWIK